MTRNIVDRSEDQTGLRPNGKKNKIGNQQSVSCCVNRDRRGEFHGIGKYGKPARALSPIEPDTELTGREVGCRNGGCVEAGGGWKGRSR